MAQDKSKGRFTWYDLMTSDPEAAVDFYTQITGWGTDQWQGPADASADRPPYTMWTHNGTSLGGVMQLPEEAARAGAPPHWLAYISTPDVDATLKRAGELGAAQLEPPTDIPTVGRFAVITDPQGASLALFTSAKETPNHDGKRGIGEISWHELITTNYEAAYSFYTDLFGWQVKEDMDMGPHGIYRIFEHHGVPQGGIFNKPPDIPMAAWLYYIHVADLDATVALVEKLGGKILNGPMEVPGGDRVAQCLDPQGAAFALHTSAS